MPEVCTRCGGTGYEVDDKALGHEMRVARLRKGLSLRDCAQQMGITPSYLCDLELGRRRWPAERLEAARQTVPR